MTAAVFSSSLSNDTRASSKIVQVIGRAINALVESRVQRAGKELRRLEAFIADLGRRQDHSSFFLDQADLLPFKL